jgi:hypothetical protein
MCKCKNTVARVYMLAPFVDGKKVFKEGFEYKVSICLAKRMIADGVAELSQLSQVYQNKMLKINYERV